MRIAGRLVTGVVLVALAAAPAAALDCARVKAMHEEGKQAAEIARALGLTTPDVQACLADQVDEPDPAGRRVRVPFELPGSLDELPREPNR